MNEICSICRNDIDFKKSVLTSCNHYFCSPCFFKWIEKKADCPVCRKVFKSPTNYDIEVEREILEGLEDEVRDYTNLVDELREQAFNYEYKKNTFIKACLEMDDVLKDKKKEYNSISDDINTLIKKREMLKNKAKQLEDNLKRAEINIINANQERMRRRTQSRRFGLNLIGGR